MSNTIIRKCDFCPCEAIYDAKTIYGPWAYLCQRHYNLAGSKTKGLFTLLKKDGGSANADEL